VNHLDYDDYCLELPDPIIYWVVNEERDSLSGDFTSQEEAVEKAKTFPIKTHVLRNALLISRVFTHEP